MSKLNDYKRRLRTKTTQAKLRREAQAKLDYGRQGFNGIEKTLERLSDTWPAGWSAEIVAFTGELLRTFRVVFFSPEEEPAQRVWLTQALQSSVPECCCGQPLKIIRKDHSHLRLTCQACFLFLDVRAASTDTVPTLTIKPVRSSDSSQ